MGRWVGREVGAVNEGCFHGMVWFDSIRFDSMRLRMGLLSWGGGIR